METSVATSLRAQSRGRPLRENEGLGRDCVPDTKSLDLSSKLQDLGKDRCAGKRTMPVGRVRRRQLVRLVTSTV